MQRSQCMRATSSRRARPRSGDRISWRLTRMSKIGASSEDILAQHKLSKNRQPVMEQYKSLTTDAMRGAVDRAVEERNREEMNEFFEWQMVNVRDSTPYVPRTYGSGISKPRISSSCSSGCQRQILNSDDSRERNQGRCQLRSCGAHWRGRGRHSIHF